MQPLFHIYFLYPSSSSFLTSSSIAPALFGNFAAKAVNYRPFTISYSFILLIISGTQYATRKNSVAIF